MPGVKTASAPPTTAANPASVATEGRPVTSSRPSASCAPPRTASAPIISARRENRSATTPPSSKNTTRAIACAPSTAPRSLAEPVSFRIANASATGTSVVPKADTVWPANSSWKLRSRQALTSAA